MKIENTSTIKALKSVKDDSRVAIITVSLSPSESLKGKDFDKKFESAVQASMKIVDNYFVDNDEKEPEYFSSTTLILESGAKLTYETFDIQNDLTPEQIYPELSKQGAFKKVIGQLLSSVTDGDCLNIHNMLDGGTSSNDSAIHQVKEKLLSNDFFTNQTNLTGYDWLRLFHYLESVNLKLPNSL